MVRTSRRARGATVLTAVLLALVAPSASAKGGEVGGSGAVYYLANSFVTAADVVFSYGRDDDQVYFGDWDGDGVDSPVVRRGATFYFRNSNSSGPAERVVTYGRPGDVVLFGDWDGDGRDTFAVRRGASYYVKNAIEGGEADSVVVYGRSTDQVLVGDWDGDGRDTFAVRRGASYYVKNAIEGGEADSVVVYGRSSDRSFSGDWDGDGTDSLGLRRDPLAEIREAGGLTGPVPYAASGSVVVVAGSVAAPRNASRIVRVRVEVERGLPVDGAVFADLVMTTLNGARGWGAGESVSFARTDGEADVRLILASPATVDVLCAPVDTGGYTSCRSGNRAVINAQRWEGGAAPFNQAGGTLRQYRDYVVNHEVGHFLGKGHQYCPAPGRLAPVMQQQTLYMDGCLPNGWPYP